MRPRLLFNIAAICLLLAAATVWAQLPHVEPKAPAPKKPSALGNPLEEFGRPVWEKGLGNPLEKPTAERAAFADSPQFNLLSKVVPGLTPGSVRIVPGAVKQFSQQFEIGARDPDRFLSEIPPARLAEWNDTPREKRIFVIGAGKDSAEVSEFADLRKRDGYSVFFYDFCRPLCSSKAVGAMFGRSGHTVLYQTSSAELSKYVKVEVETARFLDGHDKQVILISTEELLAGPFNMYVANMPTPTPSALK